MYLTAIITYYNKKLYIHIYFCDEIILLLRINFFNKPIGSANIYNDVTNTIIVRSFQSQSWPTLLRFKKK